MTTIRTRFAPSPTGSLHLGGARTALFAWAYAKHCGGEFVLRIEDTDKERSEQRHVATIFEGLSWLGLESDIEPMYQSKRFERYREVLMTLLNTGNAYVCDCTKERLTTLREEQMKSKVKPKYDGRCRDRGLALGTPGSVVRFRNPQSGEVSFTDSVRGEITVAQSELDDLILWRSDDSPTYNFTVVIDDSDSAITHVIRGDDHINNTPRQMNLFTALDKPAPKYAHIPMILGPDMKKLSKRHGALSILEYRDAGILSAALVNYLARLGWSHGDDEIFSSEQFIEWFTFESLNNSAAAYDPEKLNWVNQQYLQHGDRVEAISALEAQFARMNVETTNGPALADILVAQATRCKTLQEIVEKSRFFYQDLNEYDETASAKHLTADALPVLDYMKEHLQSVDWNKESIKQVVNDALSTLELKMAKIAQPLRVALTGNTISPAIDETLLLMGRDKVLARLERARTWLSAQPV